VDSCANEAILISLVRSLYTEEQLRAGDGPEVMLHYYDDPNGCDACRSNPTSSMETNGCTQLDKDMLCLNTLAYFPALIGALCQLNSASDWVAPSCEQMCSNVLYPGRCDGPPPPPPAPLTPPPPHPFPPP